MRILSLKFVDIPPAESVNADQAIPDIDQVRILSMSHKYNPTRMHAGLLIYSVDGQTDCIINGQFADAMRWGPSSPSHTTPMHPTERKLLEIVLVSLYINHAWLSMPIASHVNMETLSQSAKKQYLLKLAAIEQQFNKRRQERAQPSYAALSNFWTPHSHRSIMVRVFAS
jgi:hypothetical protein